MLSLRFNIILIKSFEWWISIQQMFLSIQVYKYNRRQYLISLQFESLSTHETGPIVESWKWKEFAKPLLAPVLNYDVAPSMITSGERRKVSFLVCNARTWGRRHSLPICSLSLTNCSSWTLGRGNFSTFFVLSILFNISLCTATNISLQNLRWIKKNVKPCDQMILRLKLCFFTNKGRH